MIVRDQRKSGRDVQGFADSHNGAENINLVEISRISHHQRDERPDEETADDQPFPVDPVGDHAGDRAHKAVYPQEYRHQASEVRGRFQFGNIDHHGRLHG